MKTFRCSCSSRLFFNNTRCVACQRAVGLCASCRHVAAFEPQADQVQSDRFRCTHCDALIRLCSNRVDHQTCNGSVDAGDEQSLCRYCRLNHIIPDLSVDGNLANWRRLELAKHRVLYDCEGIGLPIQDDDEPEGCPYLRFEFKSGIVEPVSTGHADGIITIEIGEADSVKREQTRVMFGEPQRTLVGHFRHELGHYYWQRLVEPHCLAKYRTVFGDEREPSYGVAKDQYYQDGPPTNWSDRYISQYASMHSWEDFAETFNAYLDMIAVVGTAADFAPRAPDLHEVHRDQAVTFSNLLAAYAHIGFLANELNRDMGLLDLVPEIFAPAIVGKLEFVHNMIANIPKSIPA